MQTTVKKLPRSEIEISAELPADAFEAYRAKALARLRQEFELPGFRKGHVPESLLLEKVPEMHILEEMAEMAIGDAYPKIVDEQKLDPIGRPAVSITKIAKGNPLAFVIKTAVVPAVKLPDYKKIAGKIMSEKEDLVVTDEEIERTVNEIRKMRSGAAPDHEPQTGQAEGVTGAKDSETEKKEPELQELTDDYVKTLGDFKDVAEFKLKLSENIRLEKERAAQEKKRVKLLDALVEKSEIDLPNIIIEEEKNKLIYQLRHDVERLGMKWEEYLKNVKKTEDDIKKEWEHEAVKRAKIQFVVSEISGAEKLTPTEEELESEVKQLLERYKGQDLDEARARLYVASVLSNQKVIEFLENQNGEEK